MKVKESLKNLAMFTLVGIIFYAFKAGEVIYKLKRKLKKPQHICLFCNKPINRGGGVDLGNGEGICLDCARKGVNGDGM